LISEELVSYDNRNENDADMPDVPDSNQERALKPRIMETCGRCGEVKDFKDKPLKITIEEVL
jgi:hypothetical protein